LAMQQKIFLARYCLLYLQLYHGISDQPTEKLFLLILIHKQAILTEKRIFLSQNCTA